LFTGATHCARCLAPITPSESEIAEAAVDVAVAAGRWHDPARQADVWRPDVRHTEPRPAMIHSRIRGGVLSFSLPTKIALTFTVVLGVPLIAWQVANGLAFGPIAIWSITVTPRVLRDLWRRTRIV